MDTGSEFYSIFACRYRVWGCGDRPFPSACHPYRQGTWLTWGVLQTESPQPDELDGNRVCVCCGYILPRLPRGSTNQIRSLQRTIQLLSNQVVLHIQHPHHPAERPRVQPVLHLTDAGSEVQWEHPGQLAWRVGGRRGWWTCTLLPRRRSVLLPLASGGVLARTGGPHPRCPLHHLHVGILRLLLQDLDWSVWLQRQGCKYEMGREI